MSADMMVVCKEYNNDFARMIKPANEGTPLPELNQNKEEDAYQIDETSMGEPWTEFGKWFGSRFCKAPGILEQLHGITGHKWSIFTEVDYKEVEKALIKMENTIKDKKEFLVYMKKLIGKNISTENW